MGGWGALGTVAGGLGVTAYSVRVAGCVSLGCIDACLSLGFVWHAVVACTCSRRTHVPASNYSPSTTTLTTTLSTPPRRHAVVLLCCVMCVHRQAARLMLA